MTPERWQQIKQLCHSALEHEVSERGAFLDQACAGDESLRRDVESLLAFEERAEGFIEAPALEAAARKMADETTPSLVGREIGHYHVVSLLGAGGMGEVYRARDTRLNREVAIKVLPAHLTQDPIALARFEREAQVVAALSHPNILSIHDFGTDQGTHYAVMELLDGETLRRRLTGSPLPWREAVGIGIPVVEGLTAAHAKGIIHRDLKPENIFLTSDGRVKVLDFGLARRKPAATLSATSKTPTVPDVTEPGMVMGTVGYMSPEQVRGEEADEGSDVFSFGCVLYEMVSGERPFARGTAVETMAAILKDEPKRLSELRKDVPPEIEEITARCLEKRTAERFQSSRDLGLALTGLLSGSRANATFRASSGLRIPALLILLILGLALGWLFHRQSKVRWASEKLLPEISRLIDEDKYVDAFALARQAEEYIPGHPLLVKFWPALSASVSIRTTPPGADVYMKEYDAVDGAWTHVGKSPLENIRIPSGLFRWKVEKKGFATVEDVASGWSPLSFTLDPIESTPPGMVRLAGTTISLKMPGFENVKPVQLQDYWMDRYEVSNKQFKRFVESGGYQKREYWKYPFRKEGRAVSWEDAMAEFRDVTGRPGPGAWEGGDYPKGQDEFPVGGVSWYEAAAYAEFAGKSLPTVYHWNNAAITIQALVSPYIFPLSNFGGRGLAQPGSHHGMSRSGTYDMAGNVKEWCLNEADGHRRYILGGAWDEPAYTFHEADARPPFERLATFGFRCVKYFATNAMSQAAIEPLAPGVRNYENEQAVSEEVFRVYRDMYSYDKTALNSAIESIDEGDPDWKKERITFDAAYGRERMIAYLFLPRNSDPPYQTVVHFPGAESILIRSSDKLFAMLRIDFILKSGRAVLWPIYKGTYERGDDLKWYFPDTSTSYRDHVIQWSKDLGRSIDYLESRPDIDRSKIAFYGYSWGACVGAILPAVEDRLKASVLMGPGFYFPKSRPEVDQINFAPRVRIPTLMIDGRYDFLFPRETSQEPLYRLLGTPKEHKRLAHFDGGHFVPRHHLIKETLDWLDRYLGPARRKEP